MEQNNISVGVVEKELMRRLSLIYGDREARAVINLIFHSLKGWNQTDLLINRDLPAHKHLIEKIGEILMRLESNEPIQYILGEAYFHGLNLKVAPGVLIPRPETSELVDFIVDEYGSASNLHILDLGTGSGAVAVALGRSLRFPEITALDCSKDALQIASDNARKLSVNIDFIEADMLKWRPKSRIFDIIVSNPPYILDSEKETMEKTVLDYEPSIALFTDNNDPLKFVRAITEIGINGLKPNGQLFMEINPLLASEIQDYLRKLGYQDVDIIRDSHGKQRFISAVYAK